MLRDADLRACRICLSSLGGEGLIFPCACHAPVHRQCLDRVRANPAKPHCIYRCDKCDVEYKLRPKYGESSAQRRRKAKFHALVLRDFFVVFCIIQFIIVILGAIIREIDKASAYCVPTCQVPVNGTAPDPCVACPPIKAVLFPASMEDHDRITYYVCGFITFLALIGFFGLCNSFCECLAKPAPPPSSSRDPPCYCGDCYCRCDCPKGGGDCGGDDGNATIIIVIAIIIIMFAIVGIFYGIVLATALFQRIVQRHIRTLELRVIAADYPVADLADMTQDQDIPYATVLSDVREMV